MRKMTLKRCLNIQITKLDEVPKKNKYIPVKVSEMGNIIEIQYMSKRNSKQTIQMQKGGEEFVILATGEIKEVQHGTTRKDNKKGLYKTFANIRAIINTNVTDVSKVRWCTLTYKENMTDTKKLYQDFTNFNKRFCYFCTKNGFDKAEYIAVFEPQKRGAWHCHLLYIWDKQAPFIPNKTLAELWGHGFVQIRQLNNIDNIGAYLTAYLTDLDLSECTILDLNEKSVIKECEVPTTNGTTKKAVVKGSRLKLYPAGFQIMRHSKGIKKPTQTIMSQTEAITKVQGAVKTFERAYRLYDEETGFESVIVKEQFNFNKKIGVNNNGKF